MNLKKAVQATEVTENTERTMSYNSFQPCLTDDWRLSTKHWFFLCGLCVLCGQMRFLG